MCVYTTGRDIETEQHGGTWLGVSKKGKFAALTNFRSHHGHYNTAAKSRGGHRLSTHTCHIAHSTAAIHVLLSGSTIDIYSSDALLEL